MTADRTSPGSETNTFLSALSLVHPEAAAMRVAVRGSSHAALLGRSTGVETGSIDLAIIAPTRAEAGGRWLDDVLDELVPSLAPDAVVYLFASPRRRGRAGRRLRRHGLLPELAILHVPSVASSRYLAPLDPPALAWALENVVAVWPHRRRLLRVLLRFPATAPLLRRLLDSVAIVFRHPGARPLFEWLGPASQTNQNGTELVLMGAADDGKLLVLSAPSRANPTAVKIRELGSSSLEREAEILREIGAGARAAGIDVPRPLEVRQLAGRAMLFEEVLAGQSAAALLSVRGSAFPEVVVALADWLEAWGRATVSRRRLDLGELDGRLLEPARSVAPGLSGGADYVAWLEELAARVAEASIPLVSAHNDLTMFNVLVRDSGIGVVDWETAAPDQLPLADFAYAAVDAAAAAMRYEDRLQAFQAVFRGAGQEARLVRLRLRRLASAVGASPLASELAFHACWVGHAHNERQVARTDKRPFFAILREVARRRDEWRELFRE